MLWRRLHRWISLVALLLVAYVAVTGMMLSLDELFVRRSPGFPALLMQAGSEDPRALHPPVDNYPAPLPAASLRPMLATVLAGFARADPGVAIGSVRLRMEGGRAQGIVTTAGPQPRRIVIDALSGAAIQPLPSRRDPYMISQYAHQVVKRLHRGDWLAGLPGRWLGWATGLALIYLAGSGIQMYLAMLGRRRRQGRGAWFW